MTPMIDVIFLLLVFFVCTASFQAIEESLPAAISWAGSTAERPVDPELLDLDQVVVRIRARQGVTAWEVNGRPLASLEEVRDVLEGIAAVQIDLPVILDPDPEVPIEAVIDVYDLCRQVRLVRVQFAAAAIG